MTNSNHTLDSTIKSIYMDSDKVNYFVKDSSTDTTIAECATEEEAVKAINDIFRNIINGSAPATAETKYLYGQAEKSGEDSWTLTFLKDKPEGISAKVDEQWSKEDQLEVARNLLGIPVLDEVTVVNERKQ